LRRWRHYLPRRRAFKEGSSMLRVSWMAIALALGTMVAYAKGQEPTPAATTSQTKAFEPDTSEVTTTGMVTPTPEMWFYEQERRREDDPKMAVRRKAEARAQARMSRLAACRWYGISNSRPTVSPTPWDAGYSPYWGSNSYEAMRWRPANAVISARPTSTY
jgi:hypothetical protein